MAVKSTSHPGKYLYRNQMHDLVSHDLDRAYWRTPSPHLRVGSRFMDKPLICFSD